MRRLFGSKLFLALLALAMTLPVNSALACAACYGKSDSPLAKGMNWGIFSLLAVVVGVLGTIASFFIFLARRAAAMDAAQHEALPSTQKA